jgi:transposase
VDIHDWGVSPAEDDPMAPPHKYPAEYRAHAVELWRTSGKSQRAVATELGISNELLRQWIRQADADSGADQARLSSTERQELRHLRAEVKTLRMERDFLKKAAAFFAKESDRTR